MLRRLAVLVALVVFVASCSSSDAATTTLPPVTTTTAPVETSTTTSTTTTTTTTTRPPTTVTLRGAMSSEMRQVVEGFYNHLIDPANPPPERTRPRLLAAAEGHPVTPGTAPASVTGAELENGDWVAVVSVGDDILLTVTDDRGPRIVGTMLAGRDPWLGPQPLRRVLIIGSDAREGQDQLRLRADSLHVLSILPKTGEGSFVGIPRDSWVRGSKITNLLPAGGPEFMVDVVSDLTDLEFEGYVAVGFEGFTDLMAALGDLEIDLPTAMRSGNNWDSYPAGPQVLDPRLVLRLARIRKGLPRGDFDRSLNQGRIVLAAMAAVQQMGIDKLPHWVDVLDRFAFTNLETEPLLTLGAAAFVGTPEDITNVVIPGSLGTVGSASVVFLGGGAEAVWRDIEDGTIDD